jgi:exoribonuclease II
MAINDDTHHHEAHGDASLTGGVLHDWIYCEVLEWEEKGKEVRTMPQAIDRTRTPMRISCIKKISNFVIGGSLIFQSHL